MYEDLREAAERRVDGKRNFFIVGITFVCITVVLSMLSLYMPSIAIWLLLPVPVLAMVLGILYVHTFGFSTSGPLSTEWREEAIEREMDELARQEGIELPPAEELSKEDRLELEELARLKEKWE